MYICSYAYINIDLYEYMYVCISTACEDLNTKLFLILI